MCEDIAGDGQAGVYGPYVRASLLSTYHSLTGYAVLLFS